ncbi:interferon phi 1 [Anabas testudineus]|uniref:interferon phi 1 n=1 Tax=Anabas testudineus TaxID=64144 RepID=UPI00143D01DC|nr:interferon phi 1 [Anabas testudineus]
MLETLTHIFIFIFIMITCTTLLFVLCSVLTPALCCNWLKHYHHHSNNSLTLIRLMGGPLMDVMSPVPFPYKFYKDIRNTNEVKTQLVFVRDSLKHIFELYHRGNLSSVAWDTNHTHPFLQSIHRQTDELSQCVSKHITLQLLLVFSLQLPLYLIPNEQIYCMYRDVVITPVLFVQGWSSGSWELIRKETKRHLDHLDLLVV